MKYALTYELSEGEFNSVNTSIIEDDLAEGEVAEKSWRDGGEDLVDILIHLGLEQTLAEAIVKDRRYFIINCADVDHYVES